MELTRRTFTRGLGGMLSAASMPGKVAVSAVLPSEAGYNDAYEKLLGEYIRVEEAAIAAGRGANQASGAQTFAGRQLENFIADLDMRFDINTTAREIYGEFRARLRAEAERFNAEIAPETDRVTAKAGSREQSDANKTSAAGEPMSETATGEPTEDARSSRTRDIEPAPVSEHAVRETAPRGTA